MKKLQITEMENFNGGNAGDAFCAGFGVGSAIFTAGVIANWWNPVGWTGGLTIALVDAGCAAYASR